MSELWSVAPPAAMTRQRENAPGSVVHEKDGVAVEVGKGGRLVMTGAAGAAVFDLEGAGRLGAPGARPRHLRDGEGVVAVGQGRE